MKFIFLIFCFLVLQNVSHCQIDSLNLYDDQLIKILEDAVGSVEQNDFYTVIENLSQNPIELNSAKKIDLLNIPFISPQMADIIIEERKKRNGFKSINDLFTIKSIDPNNITLIKPFIEVKELSETENNSQSTFHINFRSRLLTDLQNRVGFNSGKYRGNKLKIYNRVKGRVGQFSFGVISEKDAGEISLTDHYAGFVKYTSNSLIRNILVGDYTFEFGQGLAIWGPYSFSKGTQAVLTPIKKSRVYHSHLSAEEQQFFRGTVFTLNFPDLSFSGFYSLRELDAGIAVDSITSLYLTGYHRTENESQKMNNVLSKVIGGSLNYQPYEFLKIGLLHYVNQFDKSFVGNNLSDLHGKIFKFSSLEYNLLYKNLNFTGEIAFNDLTFATIYNLYFALNQNIDLLISHRHYPVNYYNIYSNGFGEFNNTQNEKGYYFGVLIKNNIGKFNLYFDIFKSLNKRHASNFPSSGTDMVFNFEKMIVKNTRLSFKYKRESKELTTTANYSKKIITATKQNYRIDLNYKLGKKLSGRSRFEFVHLSRYPRNENGYLSFQEIKYRLQKRISIIGRVILFEIKSFNSRLYEFENDLQGVMSNLPLFGEGYRWYILINLRPKLNINLSFKYSELYKPNELSLSSGNSEILGNIDNRLSAQIDYRF